jgi:hypothetical protein
LFGAFTTLLLLLTFLFLFIGDGFILELLPNLGCETFLLIFLLLTDFYNPFLDLDLTIEGLRFRLFLSRLVFGIFLFELLTPRCGLLDLLLDLLLFSLSFPPTFFYLLARISALTPRFIIK